MAAESAPLASGAEQAKDFASIDGVWPGTQPMTWSAWQAPKDITLTFSPSVTGQVAGSAESGLTLNCCACAACQAGAVLGATAANSSQVSIDSALPYFIAALDSGYHWGPVGEGQTLTFSFALAADHGERGFETYTPIEQAAVREELGKYAAIANLTFVEQADSPSIALRFYQDDLTSGGYSGGFSGYAQYPTGGDVHIGYWNPEAWYLDGSLDHLLLHEIGHALGMKHPFQGGVTLPFEEDNQDHTVMSYSGGVLPDTGQLQMFDVATIHYLYGVNEAARAGMDTYRFSDRYIWDGAGIDTLSASDQTQSVHLSLEAGTWNWVGAQSSSILASGQAFIGYGTWIENAVGGSGNDWLSGNALANNLDGGMGADTLIGGGGDDQLQGGIGFDWVSYADSAQAVRVDLSLSGLQDTLGAGRDSLSGIEAVLGTALADRLTGNASANHLQGGDGSDIISGAAGNDTLDGGGGEDWLSYAEASGAVQVNLSAGTGSGAAGVDLLQGFEHIVGGAWGDQLTGNSLSNRLDGGAGADTLTGGLGDDVYLVDNTNEQVIEGMGAGFDRVEASASFSLSANLEQLILTGSLAINGVGNDQANTLLGNSAVNQLVGGAGQDTLDGGQGADTLEGGLDDDTYYVNQSGDQIVEVAGGGKDTVWASISWTLAPAVENLELTGTSAINGTGNALPNLLVGNAAANVLNGAFGPDTLEGGAGDDTYVVDNLGDSLVEVDGAGQDLVRASVSWVLGSALENLELTGGVALNATGNELSNRLVGNDLSNTLDGLAGVDSMSGGLGDDVYIVDQAGDLVTEAAGQGHDTVRAAATYRLAAEVEDLLLLGSSAIDATGNAAVNRLTGNSAANILDGGLGADLMYGGAGDDTYVVDQVGDLVSEGAGRGKDTVRASLSWTLGAELEDLLLLGSANLNATGNSLANRLTGNNGANVLNGGLGADSMYGGLGDDTYWVDQAGDLIGEAAGRGIDTVQASVSWTLGTELENLVLTGTASNGTGNGLANRLTGNAQANVLDGKSGADTMLGGDGNDTYVVDSVGDVVVEDAGRGVDTIRADVNVSLGANVENLTLFGSNYVEAYGNAQDNTIVGIFRCRVDGGAGRDTLDYSSFTSSIELNLYVNSLTCNGGRNLNSLYNIENVIGTSSNDNMRGDQQANWLQGGAGADSITGYGGNDTLTGGAGADLFAVTSLMGSSVLTDFYSRGDHFAVSNTAASIGDWDLVVDGAVTVTAPGAFAASAELVVLSSNLNGPLTAANAAQALDHASTAYYTGQTAIFAVDNGVDSAVFLFRSAGSDAVISSSELTLLATLTGTASLSTADFVWLNGLP